MMKNGKTSLKFICVRMVVTFHSLISCFLRQQRKAGRRKEKKEEFVNFASVRVCVEELEKFDEVSEYESGLANEHHAVHMSPGHMIRINGEFFRFANHCVDRVKAIKRKKDSQRYQ